MSTTVVIVGHLALRGSGDRMNAVEQAAGRRHLAACLRRDLRHWSAHMRPEEVAAAERDVARRCQDLEAEAARYERAIALYDEASRCPLPDQLAEVLRRA